MADIRVAQLSDGEVEYFTFGRGRKNFLIIPGLSLQSVMLGADAISAAFAAYTEDYTVYVVDRRRAVPEGYTVQAMARELADVLQGLGLEQIDVFGASMGGMIAQCLAVAHPELVNKLVLGSTMARWNETSRQVIRQWIDLARKQDASGLCRSFAELVYSERFREENSELIASLPAAVTAEELTRFAKIAQGCIEFDIYDRLDEIRCPVFVIGGGEDRVLTAEASVELAEKLACPLFLYEGQSHAVYDEAPDYRGRVLDFLRT